MRPFEVAIVRQADRELLNRYQKVEMLLGINVKKEYYNMIVDVEKINAEIEALKQLTAAEYCAPAVEKLYADFEASRMAKIDELVRALEICEQYQYVEETQAADEPIAEV